MKYVIWIDQNNDKSENKGYLKSFSDELKDFKFTLVSSVKEGYSCLSQYNFELVYIILSGRLAEEFLDSYEENLQKITSLTLNIIFCLYGEYHKSKKYANDPFYNPGGVVTEFIEVIKFLKMGKYNINIQPKINIQNNKNQNDKNDNNYGDKSFIFISKTLYNLSFPIIFKKFSYRFMNEDLLEKFKLFLFNNYYSSLEGIDLIKIINSSFKIPFYLFSKIFLRL